MGGGCRMSGNFERLPDLHTLDDAIEYLEDLSDQLAGGEIAPRVVRRRLRFLSTLGWLMALRGGFCGGASAANGLEWVPSELDRSRLYLDLLPHVNAGSGRFRTTRNCSVSFGVSSGEGARRGETEWMCAVASPRTERTHWRAQFG